MMMIIALEVHLENFTRVVNEIFIEILNKNFIEFFNVTKCREILRYSLLFCVIYYATPIDLPFLEYLSSIFY